MLRTGWLRKKWLLWALAGVAGGGLLLALLGAGGFFWVLAHYGRGLPDYTQLADYEPPVATHIHAGDGSLLTAYAVERRIFVPIEAIPETLVEAFLSAEDKTFYQHQGLDYPGIAVATFSNVRNKLAGRRMVGASTITQQVAKNFLLTNEVSLERKIKEAILAMRIEHAFTKDRILELYLNEIYLGQGAYGVAAAALTYFNKSLDELTIGEMAYLAALPKAPNNYHPYRRPEAAVARRNWVLGQLAENGYIDRSAMEAGRAEPLVPRQMQDAKVFRAEYFLEEVRREIITKYGGQALYQSGLTVRTSLDPRLQAIAERALKAGLIAYDRRHGWRGAAGHIDIAGDWRRALKDLPVRTGLETWRKAVVLEAGKTALKVGLDSGRTGVIAYDSLRWARPWQPGETLGPELASAGEVAVPGDVILVGETKDEGRFTLEQLPTLGGAIVALNPHSGRVLAMVGGFDFTASEFNRATQAARQPGSAFKPFVYAAAIDGGLTPSTLVLDAPFAMDQGDGKGYWKPRNSSNKFYGPSTLRLGLEFSRNLMTVRLAQYVGMDRVVETAKRFGIADDLQPTLAMALGSGETTPLRLTTAYAMLANGGRKITPSLIDVIQDRRGKVIDRSDHRDCPSCANVAWTGQQPPQLPDDRPEVIDERTAYQVVHMLEGVIERGTGRRIASLKRSLAGKTGTTNDAADAWFIGFSPDLVVGVFTGFDQPRSLGTHEEGASVAAPVFKDFMATALAGQPDVPFRIPSGIRLVRVNWKSGLPVRPGDTGAAILEAFKPGTEPQPGQPQMLDDGGALVHTDPAISAELGGIY